MGASCPRLPREKGRERLAACPFPFHPCLRGTEKLVPRSTLASPCGNGDPTLSAGQIVQARAIQSNVMVVLSGIEALTARNGSMSIGHAGCIASSVNQPLSTLAPFIPSLRYSHLKPPIRPVDEGIAIV
jgi:hypothetical protein